MSIAEFLMLHCCIFRPTCACMCLRWCPLRTKAASMLLGVSSLAPWQRDKRCESWDPTTCQAKRRTCTTRLSRGKNKYHCCFVLLLAKGHLSHSRVCLHPGTRLIKLLNPFTPKSDQLQFSLSVSHQRCHGEFGNR